MYSPSRPLFASSGSDSPGLRAPGAVAALTRPGTTPTTVGESTRAMDRRSELPSYRGCSGG